MEEYKRVLRDEPITLVCDCGNHVRFRRHVFWMICSVCGERLHLPKETIESDKE